MNQQKALKWCTIETLSNEACQVYLRRVINGTDTDKSSKDVVWLLAHCHDGVTWGRFNSATKGWLFSSTPFPTLCPKISESNLLEIRLFGSEREILIWRTENGFSGRCLFDKPEQDNSDPCRPDNEIRVLLGDRVLELSKEGFTCVGTARGLQQVVPLECIDKDFADGRWPLRLKMRHYFERDDETGAVRVAASRLVKIFKED
jgi:CRISPR-associated protein (TIGR03984 family)